MADNGQRVDQPGEALAWTVAAYASCETTEALQEDFRTEVGKLEADTVDILAALRILAETNNVCDLLDTYADDMLALAETDMATLEARLGVFEDPEAPEFEIAEPKGKGHTDHEARNSMILSAANQPPPQSSSPATSSDYQN
ncbi:MAG: hypothetical protein AAGB16_01250 [Pseudomonadota bacterium]